MIEDVTSIHFKTGMITTSNLYFYPFTDIELMQSTGLHDKNGKEIYEGDVVKGKSDSFRLSCYGEVYWDKAFCRYRINDKKRNRQYEVDWRWKLQIIGNIHEHKHLLENRS